MSRSTWSVKVTVHVDDSAARRRRDGPSTLNPMSMLGFTPSWAAIVVKSKACTAALGDPMPKSVKETRTLQSVAEDTLWLGRGVGVEVGWCDGVFVGGLVESHAADPVLNWKVPCAQTEQSVAPELA